MNKRIVFSLVLFFLLIACKREPRQSKELNLVPETAKLTPDYWCTWGAQNFAADTVSLLNSLALGGHSVTAEYVTEQWIFGPGGWSDAIPEILKQDLIVVFDVGWDVRAGEMFDDSRWKQGSLEVAEDKSPSFTGTRKEKLEKLNSLVQSHGWKASGLWLPSQAYNNADPKQGLSEDETRVYFENAARDCGEAGIAYWKIDYGSREVIQTAHARVARGMALPEVRAEVDLPFVICSQHPNGAVAVATLPRVSPGKAVYSPLADVTIHVDDPLVPIGIFGHYNNLRIEFDNAVQPGDLMVMGQDLASERVVDLSSEIQIQRDYLIIPGDVITRTGLMAAREGDLSEPGMVLQILTPENK